MSGPGLSEDCVAAALERSRVPADARTRRLLVELWSRRDDESPPGTFEMPAASALGEAALDGDIDGPELVRRVLRLGRTLAEVALRPADADAPAYLRLVALTDEAATSALAAYGRACAERRDAWLSYLTHEIKNPLNTLLNALWLLREHRGSTGTDRFLELAERAVRRIEALTRQVRDLQRHDLQPLPARGEPFAAAAQPEGKPGQ